MHMKIVLQQNSILFFCTLYQSTPWLSIYIITALLGVVALVIGLA